MRLVGSHGARWVRRLYADVMESEQKRKRPDGPLQPVQPELLCLLGRDKFRESKVMPEIAALPFLIAASQ